MSYSFNVKAPNKAAAKELVAAEYRKVTLQQPVHQVDVPAAQALANANIDALPDDPRLHVYVNCYVSVSWDGLFGGEDFKLKSVNTTVNASLTSA